MFVDKRQKDLQENVLQVSKKMIFKKNENKV